MRALANKCAELWEKQRYHMGFPLVRSETEREEWLSLFKKRYPDEDAEGEALHG